MPEAGYTIQDSTVGTFAHVLDLVSCNTKHMQGGDCCALRSAGGQQLSPVERSSWE